MSNLQKKARPRGPPSVFFVSFKHDFVTEIYSHFRHLHTAPCRNGQLSREWNTNLVYLLSPLMFAV